MPYYLSETREEDAQVQREGFTEIARYLHEVDPFDRLVSAHPTQRGRQQVEDDSVLDFEMLQTGHGDRESLPNTVRLVTEAHAETPTMPVINSEVNYEGIMETCREEVVRLMFWASLLSGTCGHTYGANGIWQVNTWERPFGRSPHGAIWGNTPWREAMRLPGGTQLGLARRLLECYAWERFEPHQEWVQPAGSPEDVKAPFAAGIPGRVRVIYLYDPTFPWSSEPMAVVGLEAGVHYRAFYWDPRTGGEHDLGLVKPDAHGRWPVPLQPTMQDWVLVLEADGMR